MPIPEKPSVEGLEKRWSEVWEAEGTYAFDRLPSQQSDPAEADRVEALARTALATAGPEG